MKTNKNLTDAAFNRMVQQNGYLAWQITGMNITDLKRLLQSLRISKKDIDNFADFLDRDENGFIEYSNFVKAICDFGSYDPKRPPKEVADPGINQEGAKTNTEVPLEKAMANEVVDQDENYDDDFEF